MQRFVWYEYPFSGGDRVQTFLSLFLSHYYIANVVSNTNGNGKVKQEVLYDRRNMKVKA